MGGQGAAFGLVEFAKMGSAHVCKTQQNFLVEGRVLTFSESRSIVDEASLLEQCVQLQHPVVDAINMGAVLSKDGFLSAKLKKVKEAAVAISGTTALAPWEHAKEPEPAAKDSSDEEEAKKEKKAK